MRKITERTWLLLGLLVLSAAALAFVYWNTWMAEPAPELEISAETVDGTVIDSIGEFVVTGTAGWDLDELAARLDILPQAEFRLQPTGENTAALRTYQPLPAGEEIAISLRSDRDILQRTWHFRTQEGFRLLHTFPVDGAEEASTETAVEMLFSYPDVDVESAKKHISIQPDVTNDLFRQGNRLVLSAWNGYFPATTTFEVTIDADLARENGETLGEEIRFSFTTGEEENLDYRLSSLRARVTENAVPGDDVLLKLDLGDALYETPLTTTVYRYPSHQGYKAALRSYREQLLEWEYTTSLDRWNGSWQADTTGLEEVMQFSAASVTLDDRQYERYILLQDTLDAGWYAATVEATLPSGKTVMASKLIQVSPLSVYSAQTLDFSTDNESEMLFWINNAETGNPVEKAEIAVAASNFTATGKTGADGIAQVSGVVEELKTGENADDYIYAPRSPVYALLQVESGDDVFYDLYGDGTFAYFSSQRHSNDYYAYLFSDRAVYRRTDTMKIWGIVRPRVEGAALPPLRLTVAEDTLQVPVTPKEDGTFVAEVELEAMRGNYLSLELRDTTENTDSYASLWLRLEDYVKPEYNTTLALSKPFYTAWDTAGIGVDFTAHYYEGAPAQNYTAVIRPDDQYGYAQSTFPEVAISTDETGRAEAVVYPVEQEQEYATESWRPQQIALGVYSDAELNVPQVQGGSFYFLPRDQMLTLKAGETGEVLAAVHHIDTSRIQTEADVLVDDNLRGAPATTELTAEVHKTWFEKIPDGERYDPISKTSVTAYRNDYQDEVVDTITATTGADGTHTFAGLPAEEEGASYYVEVTLTDSRGKTVQETLHYDYARQARWSDYQHNFRLKRRETEDTQEVPIGGVYGQTFSANETLEIYLTDYDEAFTGEGRMLYTVAQDHFLQADIAEMSGFTLPVEEELLPNFSLCGAYFDGRHVYGFATAAFGFDPAGRELNVEILPEKVQYKPRDEANITVRVTETATGEPAANASMIAAVVDEAVFAVEEQTPDFLNKLYAYKHFSPIVSYTSHDNHALDDGGMGGGGPDPFSPRVDFPDTAAFAELRTDRQGEAVFTVPLPDSLTSWRVTALAVTPDLGAGDAKENFAVRKDFFVSPVLAPQILEGDDLVLTVHSAGEKIQPEDPVAYTCTLEGMDDVYTAEGKAGDFTAMAFHNLPKEGLAAGEYSLTVTGKSGAYTDAVTLPLAVQRSGQAVTATRRMPLAEASALQSMRWPVTLNFYDRAYTLPMEILSYLHINSEGARLDQLLARRYVTEQMLASGMDAKTLDTSVFSDSLEEYYPEYSSFRLFPYAEISEVLTARVNLAVDGDPDAYNGTSQYYGDYASIQDPMDRAAAYLIDSRYGEGRSAKMTAQITAELEKGTYSFRESMYLLMALAESGEKEAAASRFDALVTPLLQEQTDPDGTTMLAVLRGDTPNMEDTAAACLAATLLEKDALAEKTAQYLIAAPPTEELYLLELLYYLRSHPLPEKETPLTVRYTLDGEEQEVRLAPGFAYRSFSKEQLQQADFQADGDVWVRALYTAGLEEAFDRDNRLMQVRRTIEPLEGTTLQKGELARVTIQIQPDDSVRLQPYTSLKIEDYVPTGMRYESMDSQGNWSLTQRDNQHVTFVCSYEDLGTLVYYARCVAPGNYVSESAFAGTYNGGVWGASEREMLHIVP